MSESKVLYFLYKISNDYFKHDAGNKLKLGLYYTLGILNQKEIYFNIH